MTKSVSYSMTLGKGEQNAYKMGAEMKFSFIKPDKLLLRPENELEIYEIGGVMGETKIPHTIRVAGEMGKPEARKIKDISISTKDLWVWLKDFKEPKK